MLTKGDLKSIDQLITKRISPLEKAQTEMQKGQASIQGDIQSLQKGQALMQADINGLKLGQKRLERAIKKEHKIGGDIFSLARPGLANFKPL